MRLEYRIELDDVQVPRFSVEAQEGIGKLFTLATVVFNVLETKGAVEIVFHGLNPDDPTRKIEAFRQIVQSCGVEREPSFEDGASGRIGDSSSYFKWLRLRV